jgi:hypothetical protein
MVAAMPAGQLRASGWQLARSADDRRAARGDAAGTAKSDAYAAAGAASVAMSITKR